MNGDDLSIIHEFKSFIDDKRFPCVAAKTAMEKQQISCMVAEHMACPKDDEAILQFLYGFVNFYRESTTLFHSASIIFKGPELHHEATFDALMWQRLQALADLDAQSNGYDKRVDMHPGSPNFSFSLMEEAFFIIGMNPASSRPARRFKYPALVFNPHLQFEYMRQTNRYEKMKNIVRKRDLAYSGSVNPMLEDFGTHSEVYQYSGLNYDESWQCPLIIRHADEHHSST